MAKKKVARMLALLLTLALFGAACGSSGDKEPKAEVTEKAAATSDTKAATLRATLTELLEEHVYLAALATGAALRGDTAGFNAYAAALNGPTNSNSADLAAGIASVYGKDVGTAFDGLWRSQGHIPAVVAYTQALAKGDKAGADKAVADLLAYAETFGKTMNSVNENLPAAAVTDGVKMHITTLKAVIDAQKAGDPVKAASALREAAHHMGAFAATLTEATVKKFPAKF